LESELFDGEITLTALVTDVRPMRTGDADLRLYITTVQDG